MQNEGRNKCRMQSAECRMSGGQSPHPNLMSVNSAFSKNVGQDENKLSCQITTLPKRVGQDVNKLSCKKGSF